MTPEQFVYWLQGFAELHGETPSDAQWEDIQRHLNLVLEKKTSLSSIAPWVRREMNSWKLETKPTDSTLYC